MVESNLENHGFEKCKERGTCHQCDSESQEIWFLSDGQEYPDEGECYCLRCALAKIQKDKADLRVFEEWHDKNKCPSCGYPDEEAICPNCGHRKPPANGDV